MTARPTRASSAPDFARELSDIYTPTLEEIQFATTTARSDSLRFNLLLLLKCFQRLGSFPALDEIPEVLITHIRTSMGLSPDQAPFGYDTPRTLYRHHKLIREYLGVTPYGKAARHQAALAVREAARRMDRPTDLINVAIETLVKERFELPAFSTLDTLARRVRTLVNTAFFRQVDAHLTEEERARLDGLLVTSSPTGKSGHARLKARPANVTPTYLGEWDAHLEWLLALGTPPVRWPVFPRPNAPTGPPKRGRSMRPPRQRLPRSSGTPCCCV